MPPIVALGGNTTLVRNDLEPSRDNTSASAFEFDRLAAEAWADAITVCVIAEER